MRFCSRRNFGKASALANGFTFARGQIVVTTDADMQYDPSRPVSRQEVYVAFKDSPEGRAMAKQFSDGLRQLKASGRYQAITRGITFGGGCAGR